MKRGRDDGRPLQYAAARVVLWLLDNFPAHVESLLFPNDVHMPVRAAHVHGGLTLAV